MANGNGYTAAEVIAAIQNTRGFVTTIAKNLGCSRMHVYRLIEKYPTAKEALANEREGVKDFAEGKLLEQINAGNITAIIFYLKCQGKERGYIERQEVGHSGQLDVVGMSIDEWRKEQERRRKEVTDTLEMFDEDEVA